MVKIKFRAWDVIGKRMLAWEDIFHFPALEIFPGTPEQRAYEIMQFTGLRDKKGKEIYEGDIVQNPDYFGCVSGWGDAEDIFPTRRIVVWNQNGARFDWEFIAKQIRGRGCSGYCLCDGNTHMFEVIGNIYENLELFGSEGL